jgi:hypothetical protein
MARIRGKQQTRAARGKTAASSATPDYQEKEGHPFQVLCSLYLFLPFISQTPNG